MKQDTSTSRWISESEVSQSGIAQPDRIDADLGIGKSDEAKALKILIVAGFYPPYAPFAASRVVKFAKYLLAAGHDVRVLGARNPKHPPILQNEIPNNRVIYADFTDVAEIPGRILDKLRGLTGRGQNEDSSSAAPSPAASPQASTEETPARRGLRQRLSALYHEWTNIPDHYVGWYRHAVRAGRTLFADWKPDILYATAPPHTGLLVAGRLAQIAQRPWVAEFRDLWVHHPYYDAPPFRRWIDTRLEARALRNVSAYVTVTANWTKLLGDLTDKPVLLALNGFDPADFESRGPAAAPDARLTMLYAGGLYENKRDPSPLFEALRAMGPDAKDIAVDFYVPERTELDRLIAKYGVEASVKAHPPIKQAEILDLEAAADALLLLRWDDPGENSVIAGKFFEYIGAGRPILSVGSVKGEVAEIIRENGFGVVSKDPAEIEATLRSWLEIKRRDGHLPSLTPEKRQQFERVLQFRKIENLLESLVKS